MRLFTCFFVLLSSGSLVTAEDWPQWQGVNRDAISQDTGLLQEWPEGGPKLTWRTEGLGGGDSAPAIANGRVYGMSNRDGQEIVWALNESDGKEVWISSLGAAEKQDPHQSSEGPGGTPTVDGDRIYVIGMSGRVACLQASDGTSVWQKSLKTDFGGTSPMWSFRESPLIDGDRVICTPGASSAVMVALNKANGEVIWKTSAPANPEPEAAPNNGNPPAEGDRGPQGRRGRRGGGGNRTGAAYSSVIAIDYEGSRQYVQMTSSALIGVSADNGEFLWQYKKPSNGMGINCSTPIYQDGFIFAASAYGAGGGAVKLKKTDDGKFEAEEVYFTTNMQNHHGGMILIDGAIYGANGGNGGGMMACIDFQTGETLWRDRKGPKGSLLYADGRLYLRSEEGSVALVEPSKEGYIERGRFEQPDRTSLPAWAHPVLANGKLYIRDQGLLLCYDVKAQK